jgi:hypothetical protein
MNSLENKVLGVFEKNADICVKCGAECPERYKSLKPPHGPLSFFNIGDGFAEDKYKILFVGKNTWYNKDDVEKLEGFPEYPKSAFRDCRDDGRDMFEHNCSMFWRCIREITQELYGDPDLYPQCKNSSGRWDFDKLWEHIAVTNLTKCNTSTETDSGDSTPYYFTEHCKGFFEKEVENLKPTHLILFLGRGYDQCIKELTFVKNNSKVNDEGYTDDKKWIPIGERKRKVWWWQEKFFESGKNLFFLRTRHPQGAPAEFAKEIATWIQKSKA